jgi:hypothetical protein
MLDDQGEYYELPIAVVADELGLTMNQVSMMIAQGEIQPPDEDEHERITRDELGRIAEIGGGELLRRSDQEASEVFEQAVPHLNRGDIVTAEREYKRLEARESLTGSYTLAFEMVLSLAKAEYDQVNWSVKFISDMEPVRRTAIMTYLGQILHGMQFKEYGASVIAEHLLAIAEGSDPYNGPESSYSERNQHYKRMDDEQQRAMFMATVVLKAIERARFKNIFNWRTPNLESIVRNAIYTALHAEATYDESAASKMFVDLVRAQIPNWYEPAKLLQNLSTKKKAASQE